MFFLFLSLLSLALCSQFNIIRGTRNEPLVDIRIISDSIPSGRLTRVKLILRGDSTGSLEHDRFQVAFGHSTIAYVSRAFSFSDTPSQLALGIGSHTSLMGQVRSVTLIRNRLYLGTANRRFTNHCFPNSTIAVPVYGESGPLYVTAAIQIYNRTIVHQSISISGEHILGVPSYVGQRWIDLLQAQGAVQTEFDTMINCNTTTISFLPSITIRFPSIGEISLEPSDYIDVVNHTTCRLLFQYRNGV